MAWTLAIRAPVSAAPLKRPCPRWNRWRHCSIRAPVSAAPLKRGKTPSGPAHPKNHHPRPRERGPVEAAEMLRTVFEQYIHPRPRERGPVEAVQELDGCNVRRVPSAPPLKR